MDVSDQRVKHLELIQAVITRQSQNSFVVRGWSVTLVSILFALIATRDAPPSAALIALVPATVFWTLDAYYLRQERLFRRLYQASASDVANGTSVVPVFSLDTTPYVSGTPSWAATLVSPTVVPIPVVLILIAVGYVLAAGPR